MPDRDIQVTGIAEVVEMLEEFPDHIVVIGFTNALHAAAEVMANELQIQTPLKQSTGGILEYQGELRENMQIKVALFNDKSGGVADIGWFRSPYSNVVQFVEFGHRMVGHKPDLKELGMVPPHPFMRPAADISAEPAIDAFARSLEDTIKANYPQKVA